MIDPASTAPPGSVLVADLHGAAHGHWGEILAVAAQQRGIRGIRGLLIDGGVRDVAELAALGFPVSARYVTVVGTGKEHPGRFGVPVRRDGAVIRPGDLVVGDADSVLAVPQTAVAPILDRADARVADERRTLAAIRAGMTTLEYYQLSSTRELTSQV